MKKYDLIPTFNSIKFDCTPPLFYLRENVLFHSEVFFLRFYFSVTLNVQFKTVF